MPKFETDESLRNRKEIADFVLRRWPLRYDGYIFLKEMLYRLDGVLYKKDDGMQKPKLFFEAKHRFVPFRHFPDFQISACKLTAAIEFRHIAQTALFIRFSDGVIAAVDARKHDGTFIIGGRPNRPGSLDVETMAVFQWDQFKIIHDPRKAEG
jgi:hypothetical protein